MSLIRAAEMRAASWERAQRKAAAKRRAAAANAARMKEWCNTTKPRLPYAD
jgi:hypothetical protein